MISKGPFTVWWASPGALSRREGLTVLHEKVSGISRFAMSDGSFIVADPAFRSLQPGNTTFRVWRVEVKTTRVQTIYIVTSIIKCLFSNSLATWVGSRSQGETGNLLQWRLLYNLFRHWVRNFRGTVYQGTRLLFNSSSSHLSWKSLRKVAKLSFFLHLLALLAFRALLFRVA